MTVTASKIGQAPLMWDWSNLGRVSSVREELAGAWDRLKGRFESGEIGFYNAPISPEISQAEESETLAREILGKGIFSDVLFLGIGGSALGPISLLDGLQEKCTTGIRFHFMENPDPVDWKTRLSQLNPQKTLVCAVTKSGTTFETLSQLILAMDWLGQDRWKTHLVAITDPKQGDLRELAQKQGLSSLAIAPSIGGRFSIFSPVGLFPAALAGLSIKDFLQGARQVREYVEKTPVEKNPLFLVGQELIRNFPRRPIHVCMPYSTRLKLFGSWFVQLWGESLGKDGKGFTPLAALGATDQHSILQLLRDGPDDKITFFITVDRVQDPVRIPSVVRQILPPMRLPSFAQLEGTSLQDLLQIEYRATSLVLNKKGRPQFSLQLDRLDERGMGALYYSFSVLTAMTGTIWGINPFDQPGVEEGKVYIRQALGEQKAHSLAESDENSPVARLRRNENQD